MKRYNEYVIVNDYVIMYTSKNEPFYVDLEDYDRIKDVFWNKNKQGYIRGRLDKHEVRLHRIIMNCPKGLVVDHIGGSKTLHDNRKSNLRIATYSQNSMNQKHRSKTCSGVKGVNWDKQKQKWEARIFVEGKKIRLGRFKILDDAIKARKEAEIKYFKEYSFDESQRLSEDLWRTR